MVVLPPGNRVIDVPLLALLRSTTEQDHEALAIFAEIDAESRSKINFVLVDTTAHALHVGEVALRQARYSCRDLDRSRRVQTIEPCGVKAATTRVEVLENFDWV